MELTMHQEVDNIAVSKTNHEVSKLDQGELDRGVRKLSR